MALGSEDIQDLLVGEVISYLLLKLDRSLKRSKVTTLGELVPRNNVHVVTIETHMFARKETKKRLWKESN